ncbi:MAG: IS110 family transposase, partial [Sporomusaceae bacterium]|nr:IS110 family transposase [Sporomusaceae bacterium]
MSSTRCSNRNNSNPSPQTCKFQTPLSCKIKSALTSATVIPPCKYFVGIDIGYKNHEAAVIPLEAFASKTQSWKRVKTFKFSSDGHGICVLLEALTRNSLNPRDFCILMEPASVYYDFGLRTAIEQAGYSIFTVPGRAVKDFRERDLGISEKSDRIDSKVIAYLGYQKTLTPSIHGIRIDRSLTLMKNPFKILAYERLSIQRQLNRRKSQLQLILNISHPEIKSIFPSRLTRIAIRRMITKYPTGNQIAATSVETLQQELLECGIRRYSLQKATEWKGLLQSSIPLEIPYLLDYQRFIIEDVDHMEAMIEQVDAEIKKMVDEHPYKEILWSLPVMGYPWACMLIGVIGDVTRFPTYKQFKKYMGFTPENKASGTSLKKTRLSLSGVRPVRRVLFFMSLVLLAPKTKQNPFKLFYNRLLGRNMPRKKAIGHVAGKLAQVIYGCLKYNRLYDPAIHLRAMEASSQK